MAWGWYLKWKSHSWIYELIKLHIWKRYFRPIYLILKWWSNGLTVPWYFLAEQCGPSLKKSTFIEKMLFVELKYWAIRYHHHTLATQFPSLSHFKLHKKTKNKNFSIWKDLQTFIKLKTNHSMANHWQQINLSYGCWA